ncbi:GNAT family N-acetyltransferase [Altererythrobacter salegens]|uniref:GNAT family N-acetyltransferase n=1 Tax=Croceibacterium salegens TaxID=1737568 RepID=A0A6I4SXD8_9SPHN|nr:GNAT family N-acetyltransferase [Croceibacterium salegens]MXO60523.1 GNAT family N-acetyltransferase [Croceibacterium salegens]
MPDFRLETDRLVLRDWRDEDFEPFFRHTNTPAVMEHIAPLLDDERKAHFRRKVIERAALYGHTLWVMERKADGAILGFCGIKRCDVAGSPIGDFEIGWRLREDCWGQGYAREAAIATRDAAFELFGAPHVVALTVERNHRSWGLMKRLGMKRREDLDFIDPTYALDGGRIILYSLDQAEWERIAA